MGSNRIAPPGISFGGPSSPPQGFGFGQPSFGTSPMAAAAGARQPGFTTFEQTLGLDNFGLPTSFTNFSYDNGSNFQWAQPSAFSSAFQPSSFVDPSASQIGLLQSLNVGGVLSNSLTGFSNGLGAANFGVGGLGASLIPFGGGSALAGLANPALAFASPFDILGASPVVPSNSASDGLGALLGTVFAGLLGGGSSSTKKTSSSKKSTKTSAATSSSTKKSTRKSAPKNINLDPFNGGAGVTTPAKNAKTAPKAANAKLKGVNNSDLQNSLNLIATDKEGAKLLKRAKELGISIKVGNPQTGKAGLTEAEKSPESLNGVTSGKEITVKNPNNLRTIAHELVHAVTPKSNSSDEEGIANIIGIRIRDRLLGKAVSEVDGVKKKLSNSQILSKTREDNSSDELDAKDDSNPLINELKQIGITV